MLAAIPFQQFPASNFFFNVTTHLSWLIMACSFYDHFNVATGGSKTSEFKLSKSDSLKALSLCWATSKWAISQLIIVKWGTYNS